jgi:hypothetical protein
MRPTTLPPTPAPAALPRAFVEELPPPVAAPRRRSVAARGRAAVLWGVVVFAVGQMALAAAIEWRLPELREPNYGHKVRRLLRRLGESPAPPRAVVMLGSSRTMYALRGQDVEHALARPDGAPVVFNFGLPGAGPLTELIVLRRLLRQGVRPDLLLVEVLAPVLAGQVSIAEVTQLGQEPGHLWHADLALAERYVAGGPLGARWWAAEALPCHSLRRAMLSALSPDLLPVAQRLDASQLIDDSGWATVTHIKKEDERRRQLTDRARGEYAHYLTGFRLGGPNPRALRELLDLCRREGIPAVLVLMPEGRDFRGWYAPPAWAEVEGFLAELRRDYGVDVVNARDWLPDEEFVDQHHEFPEGAARFSARLTREVIAPRLAGRRPGDG